ncbi:hypothetical protein GCM10029964_091100 [Kibdelosporangium lantanae]
MIAEWRSCQVPELNLTETVDVLREWRDDDGAPMHCCRRVPCFAPGRERRENDGRSAEDACTEMRSDHAVADASESNSATPSGVIVCSTALPTRLV